MTQATEPSPDELTRERDLYELYRSALKIPSHAVTKYLKLGMAIALAAYGVGSIWLSGGDLVIAKAVRDLADSGLGFASQVVGFVLAGFTIFATMNAKEFTLALARRREATTGESFLKYIYLAFMRVFASYLVLIGACVAVKLLGAPRGPLSALLELLPAIPRFVARGTVARAAFIALGSMLWFVVIDLVAFVFNVYHTVMAGVRWELEVQLRQEQGAGPARTASERGAPSDGQ